MKVYIWRDEAYPVYGIDENPFEFQETVDIPEELYDRYCKIEEEYAEVQEELKKYSRE